MKKFLMIFILSFPLFGENFLSIQSDNYFENNRINYVNDFVHEIQNEKNQFTLLSKVNLFVNEFQYASDQELYGKSNYWAKPFEFVLHGKGDCEDYVILKYAMLKFCGVPTGELSFGVKKHKGILHAVLLHKEKDGSFVSLDNNYPRIYVEDMSQVKTYPSKYIENHL